MVVVGAESERQHILHTVQVREVCMRRKYFFKYLADSDSEEEHLPSDDDGQSANV